MILDPSSFCFSAPLFLANCFIFIPFLGLISMLLVRGKEESKRGKEQKGFFLGKFLFIWERKPSPADPPYILCTELSPMSTLRTIPNSFPGAGIMHTLPEIKGIPATSCTNWGSIRRKGGLLGVGGQAGCLSGIASCGNPARTIQKALGLNLTSSLSQPQETNLRIFALYRKCSKHLPDSSKYILINMPYQVFCLYEVQIVGW